jgi:hypothetical protein
MTSREPSGKVGKRGWFPVGLRCTGQWIKRTRGAGPVSDSMVNIMGKRRTIEVVQAEIFEGQVEAFLYPVNVGRPNFRCDENLLPWYPRGLDSCAYCSFVAIRLEIGEWMYSSTRR